jgi:membrane protein implicated in regulation of membrane protease activity
VNALVIVPAIFLMWVGPGWISSDTWGYVWIGAMAVIAVAVLYAVDRLYERRLTMPGAGGQGQRSGVERQGGGTL